MKILTLFLWLLAAPLPKQGVDAAVGSLLAAKGITPGVQSDPARLVRRYCLVVTDRIPTEAQTRAFLRNPDREALVDSLLSSDGFVEKMVLKWGDLLRIKSEFPSCMWPNAVQAFNKYLTEEFRSGKPYNEFVRDLLSGTGSNFRVPQTNFYRAGSDRTPGKFASDIALLFLGRRQAPSEWEPFFSQVRFKGTKEWKEEILVLDVDVPAPDPVMLAGKEVIFEEGSDYRLPLISWLTAADNRDLARSFANRLWFWLMGDGIVNPADDMSGTPSNPALLDYLTDSFLRSGFDVRALAREILLSDAFCRTTLSTLENASDTGYFSRYPLGRLTSEQICDAICDITGVPDLYSSRAPEPFTNFPAGTRANQVCDGTITTPQLDIFGRPSRDVALESSRDNSVNSKQILYLLNSTSIQEKLHRSPFVEEVSKEADFDRMVDRIYVKVLSRPAGPEEIRAVRDWASRLRGEDSSRRVAESLVWALLNTDEFLFLN